MSELPAIVEHYTHGSLIDAIRAGVFVEGKRLESVRVEDLAPADEFHIGGRQASEHLIAQLGVEETDHVLDVGCGLGGTARFVVSTYGCRVTGIDPTPELVQTGQKLCEWVSLEDRVCLQVASGLAIPHEAETFDAAYMLHVGMNIADKKKLCAEVRRVLKPEATFGIYDVMRKSEAGLSYPVPWATTANIDSLETPGAYRQALGNSGFSILAECDRHEFAVNFFDTLRKETETAGGPSALGLHIVMGQDASLKIRNMVENLARGRVSPVEIIAKRV